MDRHLTHNNDVTTIEIINKFSLFFHYTMLQKYRQKLIYHSKIILSFRAMKRTAKF